MTRHRTLALTRRQLMQGIGATVAIGALPSGLHAANTAPTKIGMIGSGRVGAALGGVWNQLGHEVMFSSRTLADDKALAAQLGGKARAGTPREAASFGDVVVLSIPYLAMPDVSRELAPLLKGKTIIDTSNAFERRDGEIANQAHAKGIGLMTAEFFPGAHIVRAFNALPAATMASVHRNAGSIGMPIAGDDPSAVKIASKLISEIGFEPILIGGLKQGGLLRPETPFAGELAPEEIRKRMKAL